MPWRTSFSTKLWKGLDCGTSVKSAKKAWGRIAAPLHGLDRPTSFNVPPVKDGAPSITCKQLVTETCGEATPPTVTVAPAAKCAPVRWRETGPAAGPDVGAIAERPGVAVGDDAPTLRRSD